MQLKNGSLLQGGKYKIVRFIASGGFGCTYEAHHTLLDSRVALKEFFVSDFCNRDERTGNVTVGTQSKVALYGKLKNKFMDEARSLFKMKHPGIVRVIDVFEENGTAYYAMEYIDGPSLSDVLKKRGKLPEAEAVEYIRQVADALKYVHSLNRLHLDIKPGNIMLNKDGKAVLIDFGTSKHYDDETGENTSTLLGINTKGYAPVEQVNQSFKSFSPATDIYALGATLYKLLTGNTPPPSTLLHSEEATLASLPSSINPSTRQAVEAAMQLLRKKRPQNVEEWEAILIEDEETNVENVKWVTCNEEAAAFVIHPSDSAARTTGFKKYLSFAEAYRRNWFTNILLYLLAFSSLLYGIIFTFPTIVTFFDYITDEDYGFTSAYGKGYLPALLLSFVLFVGVLKLLRWQRSGITILILSSFIICVPLVWTEYECFGLFSQACLIIIIILWISLCIKKKGTSTWELCLHETSSFKILRKVILLVWLFLTFILPIVVAKIVGFNENLIWHGQSSIDAYVNPHPIYPYQIYLRIMTSHDFASNNAYIRIIKATYFLERARHLQGNSRYSWTNKLSPSAIFLHRLICIYNFQGRESAYEYIKTASDEVDFKQIVDVLLNHKDYFGDYYDLGLDESGISSDSSILNLLKRK